MDPVSEVIVWVTAHPIRAFLGYLVFMAAVQALPRPAAESNAAYVWLYRFAHLLAVNLQLVASPRKGLQMSAKRAGA